MLSPYLRLRQAPPYSHLVVNDEARGRIRRDGTRKRATLTTGERPQGKAAGSESRDAAVSPAELLQMARRRHGSAGAWELRNLKRLRRDDPDEFARLLNDVRSRPQ